jgi:hypothetical protein
VLTRVLLTAGAWLLGVAAATAGCLVAVSLIGHSLFGPPVHQLTGSDISRALAVRDQAPAPSAAGQATAVPHRPAPRPRRARPGPSRPSAPAPGRSVSPSPGPPSPVPSPPAATLLTSAGGSVLASCGPSGAYLVSWSPQQGYTSDDVVRGPAPVAVAVFLSGRQGVRMAVSCPGSRPALSVRRVTDGDPPGDE